MKLALALALALAAILAAAPARADRSILDNHKNLTIDCAKDPAVSIVGNEDNVRTKGACTSISISGNHNHVTVASSVRVDVSGNENAVTIDAVDHLSVSGNTNAVTYKRAVTAGKSPEVSTTGTDDKVVQAK